MTPPKPAETLLALIAEWQNRASLREASARRIGPDMWEAQVLYADAAAVRQCAAELLQLMTGLGST